MKEQLQEQVTKPWGGQTSPSKNMLAEVLLAEEAVSISFRLRTLLDQYSVLDMAARLTKSTSNVRKNQKRNQKGNSRFQSQEFSH